MRLALTGIGLPLGLRTARAADPTSTSSPKSVGEPSTSSNHGAVLVETQPNGAMIWQVTSKPFKQANIYCEVPYCSADSSRFVYYRVNPDHAPNKIEFVLTELGSWHQRLLDRASSLRGCAMTPGGVFYYIKAFPNEEYYLMRADLQEARPERLFRIGDAPRLRSLGTVSSDERWYAVGQALGDKYDRFGVMLLDLGTGESKILDRDPFILNPHPQFEPGEGKRLLIQHNRGGKVGPDGRIVRLVGEEGATLYILDVASGQRTPLAVGKPHTTPATGHQAWIGHTENVLLTVAARGDYTAERGNLLAVAAGEPARVVATGHRYAHVGMSRCGRLFTCDDMGGDAPVIIGSPATGKTAVACFSKTHPTRSQCSHPHPYLTPDLKWVIFNSTRTGSAHVYAARLPEGMVQGILNS